MSRAQMRVIQPRALWGRRCVHLQPKAPGGPGEHGHQFSFWLQLSCYHCQGMLSKVFSIRRRNPILWCCNRHLILLMRHWVRSGMDQQLYPGAMVLCYEEQDFCWGCLGITFLTVILKLWLVAQTRETMIVPIIRDKVAAAPRSTQLERYLKRHSQPCNFIKLIELIKKKYILQINPLGSKPAPVLSVTFFS